MRLSRKSSFLIIVVVTSLLVGGLLGFYFYQKNKNKPLPFPSISDNGKSIGYTPSVDRTGASTTTETSEQPILVIPKLRHITTQPIAGKDFVLVDIVATSTKNIEPADLSLTNLVTPKVTPPKVISTVERMRWIERGTGHIFETSTTTLDTTRLSNTTLTKIYDAFFTKGNSLILRDLFGSTDTIRTRYATLDLETPTSTEQTLTVSDLPVNMTEMVRSPDRTQTFSIMNTGVRGILSNADGSARVGIFDSPFREWLVQWPNKQNIILTTKPTGSTPGYVYSINPQTKAFSRIMGGISGLTTLVSPSATKVLFSDSSNGTFNLSVYDVKTASATSLFMRTLADKCVWSTTEADIVYCGVPQDVAFNFYPDAWYQGQIVFSDSLWSINVTTNETRRLVYPPDEAGTIIDVLNPTVSAAGDYMMFQNKIDLSLWGLRLKELPSGAFIPFGASSTPPASTSTTAR